VRSGLASTAARPRTFGPASLILTLVVMAGVGCAGGRFVRPAGAAVPFPEASNIWNDLSRPCRSVTSARAELRVSGRIAGQRVPGLTTGLAVDTGRLAIDARLSGRRVFSLAGDLPHVVLLRHLDGRVARGPAVDLVDALVGVPLTPARLLALLSGCVAVDAAVAAADRVGALARLRTRDSTIYLAERDGRWRLVAAEFEDVVADYRRIEDGWPREVELRRNPDVTLMLRVIEFERNPQLPSAVFQLQVPTSFVEMPLDDLRRDGPLGQRAP
jgi:hypothetical protein